MKPDAVGGSFPESVASQEPVRKPAVLFQSPTGSEPFLFLPGETASATVLPAFPDPLATTMKILTSLAVVVGIFLATSWLLQNKARLGSASFGKILGILPLDNRRFLCLVDVMGKVLVIGVTEHHISLLTEITDKAMIDGLRLQMQNSSIPGLERIFGFLRKNPDNKDQEIPEVSDSFARHTQKAQQQLKSIENLLIRKRDTDRKED